MSRPAEAARSLGRRASHPLPACLPAPASSNNLYALNGSTGARLWTFTTGWDITSSPALGAGGTVVFGGGDNLLRAVDRRTGTLVWSLDCGGQVQSSPAVDAAGNVCVALAG